MGNFFMAQLFALPAFLLWIASVGLGLYALILFIKLLTRGIKVLDIYIAKNQNKDDLNNY